MYYLEKLADSSSVNLRAAYTQDNCNVRKQNSTFPPRFCEIHHPLHV